MSVKVKYHHSNILRWYSRYDIQPGRCPASGWRSEGKRDPSTPHTRSSCLTNLTSFPTEPKNKYKRDGIFQELVKGLQHQFMQKQQLKSNNLLTTRRQKILASMEKKKKFKKLKEYVTGFLILQELLLESSWH